MVTADLKAMSYYSVSSKYEAQLLMLEQTGYNLKLSLTIGEKGECGGDYFTVDVFNIDLLKNTKMLLVSKSFVVNDDIELEFQHCVNSITGKDWNEVLNKLRYYFY